jgi:hypothetical protein
MSMPDPATPGNDWWSFEEHTDAVPSHGFLMPSELVELVRDLPKHAESDRADFMTTKELKAMADALPEAPAHTRRRFLTQAELVRLARSSKPRRVAAAPRITPRARTRRRRTASATRSTKSSDGDASGDADPPSGPLHAAPPLRVGAFFAPFDPRLLIHFVARRGAR